MTLSDLAALGEAVGGLAVLITLLYLAYQFRQTATIERTAGQRELLNRCRDWVELTTTQPRPEFTRLARSGVLGRALNTGQAHLALERADPDDPEAADRVGRFASVSLEVVDLQGTCDTLRSRGVDFASPPERQPWCGVLAHLRDPDGNILTLMGFWLRLLIEEASHIGRSTPNGTR